VSRETYVGMLQFTWSYLPKLLTWGAEKLFSTYGSDLLLGSCLSTGPVKPQSFQKKM